VILSEVTPSLTTQGQNTCRFFKLGLQPQSGVFVPIVEQWRIRMATMMTQLGEREFYAAMAMQGILGRERLPADEVARQAVAYADALILAIEANAKVPRMELNVEAAAPLDIPR
jgi:hypothetical protein